jgi:hypothetical protein
MLQQYFLKSAFNTRNIYLYFSMAIEIRIAEEKKYEKCDTQYDLISDLHNVSI